MTVRATVKHAVAGASARTGLLRLRHRTDGLVILMLHKVTPVPDPLHLGMPPELLAEVFDEICRHHPLVHLDDEVDDSGVRAGAGLRFAVTADDGYRNNHTRLLPLLTSQRVPATIFLAVDYLNGDRPFWFERLHSAIERATATRLESGFADLGTLPLDNPAGRAAALTALNSRLKGLDHATRERRVEQIVTALRPEGPGAVSPMLDWDMVAEMAARGVRFGSHTCAHAILSRETDETVTREVTESKIRLEKRLLMPVSGFAYPNGTSDDFDDRAVDAVRRAGYRFACTTVPGINRPADDVFRLRRINLHPGMCTDRRGRFSANLFWAKVLGVLG